MSLDERHVSDLAEQLVELLERRQVLDVQIDILKHAIASRVDVGDVVDSNAGDPLFRLVPGRRTFKQEQASQVLPLEIREACSTTIIDSGKVRELSGRLWEECCNVGEPYLSVVR